MRVRFFLGFVDPDTEITIVFPQSGKIITDITNNIYNYQDDIDNSIKKISCLDKSSLLIVVNE